MVWNKMTGTEIIIGLVGGIGTDFDLIVKELESKFLSANCNVEIIKLTELLDLKGIDKGDYLSKCKRKIELIDTLKQNERGIIANIAIAKIFLSRFQSFKKKEKKINIIILNSLKHPFEYDVLRHVYRRNFIFISIYTSGEQREQNIIKWTQNTRGANPTIFQKDHDDIKGLMQGDKDSGESSRQVIKTYHKAHYFVSEEHYTSDIDRFIQLIMNNPFITPTQDEMGMMHAYTESLRSADLGRQVGAIILNDDGNILSSGCNEVPKVGGGLHWENTIPDLRDFCVTENNVPISEQLKIEKFGSSFEDEKRTNQKEINNLLEFLRAVHAEEAAICDAAKRGVALIHSTLYSTTFPCHLCAKHIIAAGIKRVIYIEPYVKSMSERLFENLIKDKATSNDTQVVKFESFRGVAPKRFRYIFKKTSSERKGEGNSVAQWQLKDANPIHLSHSTPISYFWVEIQYLKKFISMKEHIKSELMEPITDLINSEVDLEQYFKDLVNMHGQDEILGEK